MDLDVEIKNIPRNLCTELHFFFHRPIVSYLSVPTIDRVLKLYRTQIDMWCIKHRRMIELCADFN